jgi:hypothetical protein
MERLGGREPGSDADEGAVFEVGRIEVAKRRRRRTRDTAEVEQCPRCFVSTSLGEAQYLDPGKAAKGGHLRRESAIDEDHC